MSIYLENLAATIANSPNSTLCTQLLDVWKRSANASEHLSMLLTEVFAVRKHAIVREVLDLKAPSEPIVLDETQMRKVLGLGTIRTVLDQKDIDTLDMNLENLVLSGFPLSTQIRHPSPTQSQQDGLTNTIGVMAFLINLNCIGPVQKWVEKENFSPFELSEMLLAGFNHVGVADQKEDRMALIKTLLDKGASGETLLFNGFTTKKMAPPFTTVANEALSRGRHYEKRFSSIWERLLESKKEAWIDQPSAGAAHMATWIIFGGDTGFAFKMAQDNVLPSKLKTLLTTLAIQDDLNGINCGKEMSGKTGFVVKKCIKTETDAFVSLKDLAQQLQILSVPDAAYSLPLGGPTNQAVEKTWERIFTALDPFVDPSDRHNWNQLYSLFQETALDAFGYLLERNQDGINQVTDMAIEKANLILTTPQAALPTRRLRL